MNYSGFEGSVGPGKGQYNQDHVYARDVHSGAGNCVCGLPPRNKIHPELAPGVPNYPFIFEQITVGYNALTDRIFAITNAKAEHALGIRRVSFPQGEVVTLQEILDSLMERIRRGEV